MGFIKGAGSKSQHGHLVNYLMSKLPLDKSNAEE